MISHRLSNANWLLFIAILCSCTVPEKENSNDKSELVEKLEAKENELNKEIDQLAKKSKSVGKDVQYELQEAIEKLKSEKAKINRTARRVKKASSKELKHLKRETEEVLKNSEDQFSKMKEKFKDWID